NFGYHCCWTNTQMKISVKGNGAHATTTLAVRNPPSAIGNQSAIRNPQPAIPTFAKDVAPILQRSCQTCHHEGTSAPMSLVTYEQVRPWARSIRQRVAARDMPPWHLDKTVGIRHYKNDRSLSDDEIATMVRWADNGAPQGNPADMPPALAFRSETDWFIGEPDLKGTTPNDFTMYAIGSEQHNRTTIAFKFYPKGVVPKYQVRSQAIRNIPNDELEVPPNTVVRTDGYFRLPRPARIDSFQPHMHMRGKGLTVEAIDPATNRTQILSSVDHFDFNWHVNYV